MISVEPLNQLSQPNRMAKELPYFKFEPSEWENGNIQMCSFEAQGVFMNVCSMYWQRLGDLPYKLAVQKICKGNAVAFDSLVTDQIIKVIDGMICIDFLNEQLSEFENVSETNSKNARDGWIKRRQNANSMPPHSDPNAIREEEIREEKIKVDKKKPRVLDLPFVSDEFYSSWIEWEQYKKEKKQKLTDSTAKKQLKFLSGWPEKIAILIINQSITQGWAGLFELKTQANGNGINKKTADDIATADYLRKHYSAKLKQQ